MVKKIFKPIIFEIFSKKEQIATARTNSHGQVQIATACGGPLGHAYIHTVNVYSLRKRAFLNRWKKGIATEKYKYKFNDDMSVVLLLCASNEQRKREVVFLSITI